MPYWSKGVVGLRQGGYTGPQVLSLDRARCITTNLAIMNSLASCCIYHIE